MNIHLFCIRDGYSSLLNIKDTLHCDSIDLKIYYNQEVTEMTFKKPFKSDESNTKVNDQEILNDDAQHSTYG